MVPVIEGVARSSLSSSSKQHFDRGTIGDERTSRFVDDHLGTEAGACLRFAGGELPALPSVTGSASRSLMSPSKGAVSAAYESGGARRGFRLACALERRGRGGTLCAPLRRTALLQRGAPRPLHRVPVRLRRHVHAARRFSRAIRARA
jgi:hypothetical protein